MAVRRVNWDKVGMTASSACAIHCALTGIAFGLVGGFGLAVLYHPWVEAGLMLVAAVVGALAIASGWRRHRSVIPAIVLTAGLTMLGISHFAIGHDHDHRHGFEFTGVALAVLGGLAIAASHLVNHRLGCRCDACQAKAPTLKA